MSRTEKGSHNRHRHVRGNPKHSFLPAVGLDEDLAQLSGEDQIGHAAEQRSNQQALLVEVNAILMAASDPEAAFQQMLSRLRERAKLTRAALCRLARETGLLHRVAESGDSEVEPNDTLPIEGQSLAGRAARTAEPVYAPGTGAQPGSLQGAQGTLARYAVPLCRDSRVLGVLEVTSAQPGGILAVTRKLVDQFATQAALAMEVNELRERLRAFEQRFHALLKQGNLGVAICALDGKVSSVNGALPRLLGYQSDELRGMPYAELVQPEQQQKVREILEQLVHGKSDHFGEEIAHLSKSKETVWCEVVFSLIRGPSGQPLSILTLIQDINRRKQAEEECTRLREQLVQAQKMESIGTLAGGLAHDFNNLLSVILGFASLVRVRLHPEDPLSEPMGMIEHSAERAAELTRQLLELARHAKPVAKPVRVERILEQVVKLVARTFDRKIEVRMCVEPRLPWVRADAGQLEQAMLNLCINARDVMPEGGTLTLEASLSTIGREDPPRPASCPPGQYVAIAVRDTGMGIEPEVMKRIFDPFFTTKEAGKGSGLGLAMVRGIASSYGGFVSVRSEVGAGSQFTIHLPAFQPSGKTGERTKSSPLAQGSGTVLAVDDEPMVLACTEASLKKLGYKVLKAESGSQACEIYSNRAADIDCVLLDMVMPGMSGLETYHKLREINPGVKVVLSSGYVGRDEAKEVIESDGVGFLAKPYTLEALSSVLKRTTGD